MQIKVIRLMLKVLHVVVAQTFGMQNSLSLPQICITQPFTHTFAQLLMTVD